MLRQALIVALTAGLLMLASSVTLGHVLAVVQPGIAASLIPCNAVAKATEARAIAFADDATAEQIALAKAKAHAALRCSPLIARALVVLGLAATRAGDDAAGRPFLKQAERLTRRDVDAQLLLLEDAVKRRQVGETLAHYDTALRTNVESEELLFPTLAEAVADPQLRPDVIALLRKSPPWTERFLLVAAGPTPALPYLPALLAGLDGAFKPSESLSRLIIQRLIDAGHLAPAQTLFHQATGRALSPTGRVTNGDFAEAGDWPPFDWQVTNNAGIGGSINRADPGLDAFSGGGKSGVAAQQIMALPPGNYTISTEAEASADPIAYASWVVKCATGSSRTVAALSIPATGERSAASDVFSIGPDCPYQWLRLSIAAGEPHYRRITVRSVAVERMSAAPAPVRQLRRSSRIKRARGRGRYRRF